MCGRQRRAPQKKMTSAGLRDLLIERRRMARIFILDRATVLSRLHLADNVVANNEGDHHVHEIPLDKDSISTSLDGARVH